jgi:hypothetical protein
MRARHRHFLLALVSAVAIALAAQAAPSSTTQAVGCPSSTSWDNILQRCV